MLTSLYAITGVFGIGLIIGLVVLVTAEEALLAVAKTAARDVSGSFWAGLLWQLLAVPILAVLLIACAITIIGILATPIAALAWALAYAGAFTLGRQGQIAWAWLPMLLAGSIAGGYLGAHLAIAKGSQVVKRAFEVLALLMGSSLLIKSF